MTTHSSWLCIAVGLAVVANGAGASKDQAAALHGEGVALHLERRLGEASALYAEALALEPPARPSDAQMALVRRFAPRLFVTASEPFPLRDAAAIVHPTARIIAYHLFWEDDIDFPDDNDPSDHEVVWIRHSEAGDRLEQVWTYFHGRLLSPRVVGAGRPAVHVQWGKHGSMPAEWKSIEIIPEVTEVPDGIPVSDKPIPLEQYLDGSFRKLSTSGTRLGDHPIAMRLGWPRRYQGTREAFMSFPRPVDPLRTRVAIQQRSAEPVDHPLQLSTESGVARVGRPVAARNPTYRAKAPEIYTTMTTNI